MTEYDVIVIGAGSVGVPIALTIAKEGLKTLVIDSLPSVAQGDNKHALGGIRTTHTHRGKIRICQRSIDAFANWQEKYGDDIWWERGGYTFLAYTEEDENTLKDTVKFHQNYGLNTDFVDPAKIKEIIPGINERGLRGGLYSPDDGNASPLLSIHAFFRQSKNDGAEYKFKEDVIDILKDHAKITGVKTTKGKYSSQFVVNAAGGNAREVGQMIDIDLPIVPESHEAGITEPVKRFFSTMVIDLRPSKDPVFGNSQNFYFYQNRQGRIMFCLTPDPSMVGTDRRETSSFLPQIAKRMVSIMSRLRNIKVRRTWRGLYPMTPDGNPIIGKVNECEGYINAIGMCGQGFMLGPGVGELVHRVIIDKLINDDKEILEDFSLYRDFRSQEKLK